MYFTFVLIRFVALLCFPSFVNEVFKKANLEVVYFQDVYTVDEMLPHSLRSWIGCMSNVLGTIVVIMYSTPAFGIVIIPIGILYFLAQVIIVVVIAFLFTTLLWLMDSEGSFAVIQSSCHLPTCQLYTVKVL